MTDENCNGFTVGIQRTAFEVFAPEPTSLAAATFGLAAFGATYLRRRKGQGSLS